jgi:dephospho-CoA kinase
MSAWPGKYVIGLTGNIATGKSVVRKMLEHLGAYGIDADALAHRAIAPGSPGYQPVVEFFGNWIVAEDGQIDRSRLAKIVFNEPEALLQLEKFVHPLVEQAVDLFIRRSKHKVVVIEAIKLFEGNLIKQCDSVWVTYAPEEVQLKRLLQKRGMKEEVARQRIAAQSPQSEKVDKADQVIYNHGSFEDTWQKVYTAWLKKFPEAEEIAPDQATKIGELVVQRARPHQSNDIASFIREQSKGVRKLVASDIMAAFGEKAFLLLKSNNQVCGVVGWKVENLVACTDELYLDRQIPFLEGMRFLIEEVERASKELQCEISLLFLPPEFSRQESLLSQLGYQHRTIQSLGVHAWEEAALEVLNPGSKMYFKQLRQDRVLRPV